MKKVLHITPHLGGGVGTVVLNYLIAEKQSTQFQHSIVCLDYANEYAHKLLNEAHIELEGDIHGKPHLLLSRISDADIVVLHWWNHPLLSDFLIRNELPECRIALWSHISGSPPPNNFTPKILKYPDRFVFTTPLSYNDPEVIALSEQYKNNLRVIWSTGGVERIRHIHLKKHEGFNVGYIGNLDFTKLHPHFAKMCQNINVPNVRFTVIGPRNQELEEQVRYLRLEHKIKLTGFVSEEEKWEHLAQFDVFGYPLAPHHYATCDQTLQECMAVGVVPVVLDNPMESYMVDNGVTGIVAKDIDEYTMAIEKLSRDNEVKHVLSENAKTFANNEYSLSSLINKWNDVYEEVLMLPKSPKSWLLDNGKRSLTPKEIFLESLGKHATEFMSYCNANSDADREKAISDIRALASKANWSSKANSSVHQYSTFFKDDPTLNFWSSLMS